MRRRLQEVNCQQHFHHETKQFNKAKYVRFQAVTNGTASLQVVAFHETSLIKTQGGHYKTPSTNRGNNKTREYDPVWNLEDQR